MRSIVSASAVVALLVVGTAACSAPPAAGQRPAPALERRDFMFEIRDFKSANQGGQTLNLFFHYRYSDGLAEKDFPDYRLLSKTATDVVSEAGAPRNPYWEIVSAQVCRALKNAYPIEAISCELQVHGNPAPGPWSEPGYHASIHTIGDIDPLAIAGPDGG